MADNHKRRDRLHDLGPTRIHDALVIAGRLLPNTHFFGSSTRVRVLEIDMEELVKLLSLLGVGLDIFGKEEEVVQHRPNATDCQHDAEEGGGCNDIKGKYVA